MRIHPQRLSWTMFIVIASGIYAHAQDTRRDGNWWRTIGLASQLSYMVGFVDGLALGHDFSYWSLKDLDGKIDHVAGAKAADAYDESYRLFYKTTNGQLVDGLNTLYSDYSNRRILVPDAAWVVVMKINGMSEKDLEVLLTNSRKNAAIR